MNYLTWNYFHEITHFYNMETVMKAIFPKPRDYHYPVITYELPYRVITTPELLGAIIPSHLRSMLTTRKSVRPI